MATYNDLAILRLDEGLKIDENQTRVVLPTQVEDVEAKFKDRPLHMTRYCSSHNTIEFKDIFPQDRSSCSHPYNKVSFDRVFCALFQEERKTKFKDSNDMGGPVVDRNHTLYGIVPYALFCKRMGNRYCFCGFTKIDMFMDFINDTIDTYERGIAAISATAVPLVLTICTFLHVLTYLDLLEA
nr:unnamed protein product [Callosobruchus analis]